MATKRKPAKKKSAKGATRKAAAPRRKKQKAVFLRNFTGTVSQNPDKTVSVVGKGRRGRG